MLEGALATPVKVSQSVLNGIADIRDSGMVNMFDYEGVMQLAVTLDHKDTHEWLQSNKGLYSKGIFAGFECDDVMSNILN